MGYCEENPKPMNDNDYDEDPIFDNTLSNPVFIGVCLTIFVIILVVTTIKTLSCVG